MTNKITQLHRNEVHLHGVLVTEPEIRCTPSGDALGRVTVLTAHDQHKDYHKIVAWKEQAEKLREHFHKGDYIKIAGRLQTRSWDDKTSRQKKYITEVVVWNFSDGMDTCE